MLIFTNKAETGISFHLDNKIIEVHKNKSIILNEEDYDLLMKKYGCFIKERLNKIFFIEREKINKKEELNKKLKRTQQKDGNNND